MSYQQKRINFPLLIVDALVHAQKWAIYPFLLFATTASVLKCNEPSNPWIFQSVQVPFQGATVTRMKSVVGAFCIEFTDQRVVCSTDRVWSTASVRTMTVPLDEIVQFSHLQASLGYGEAAGFSTHRGSVTWQGKIGRPMDSFLVLMKGLVHGHWVHDFDYLDFEGDLICIRDPILRNKAWCEFKGTRNIKINNQSAPNPRKRLLTLKHRIHRRWVLINEQEVDIKFKESTSREGKGYSEKLTQFSADQSTQVKLSHRPLIGSEPARIFRWANRTSLNLSESGTLYASSDLTKPSISNDGQFQSEIASVATKFDAGPMIVISMKGQALHVGENVMNTIQFPMGPPVRKIVTLQQPGHGEVIGFYYDGTIRNVKDPSAVIESGVLDMITNGDSVCVLINKIE
jgi:hypothetical protein